MREQDRRTMVKYAGKKIATEMSMTLQNFQATESVVVRNRRRSLNNYQDVK